MRRPIAHPSTLPVILLVILVGVLTGGAAVLAQSLGFDCSGRFNPETLGTFTGEVVGVEQADDYCVHAILKTPRGQITVILAPLEYLEKQGLAVKAGDRLTARGSVITLVGRPFLLAIEVAGERTIKLRDDKGIPLWAMEG